MSNNLGRLRGLLILYRRSLPKKPTEEQEHLLNLISGLVERIERENDMFEKRLVDMFEDLKQAIGFNEIDTSYITQQIFFLKKELSQLKIQTPIEKEYMDKKMAKVTKQMKKAEKNVKAGKKKAAIKDLDSAEKKNVKLTKMDREVRDPEIKAYKKMKKKGC